MEILSSTAKSSPLALRGETVLWLRSVKDDYRYHPNANKGRLVRHHFPLKTKVLRLLSGLAICWNFLKRIAAWLAFEKSNYCQFSIFLQWLKLDTDHQSRINFGHVCQWAPKRARERARVSQAVSQNVREWARESQSVQREQEWGRVGIQK